MDSPPDDLNTIAVNGRSLLLVETGGIAIHLASQVSEGRPAIPEQWLRPTGIGYADTDGTPIHPDSYSQSFERLVAASAVPRIRLHDLRHTHATILLKAGVPAKVVSERLGHANVAFTMSVYQHILPGMQADAAHIFAKIVFGDS